jgi:hypothetical protein
LGVVADPLTYGDEQRDVDMNADKQTPWNLRVQRRPVKDASKDGGLSPKAASITIKAGEWIRLVVQGSTGVSYPNPFYLEVDEVKYDSDTTLDSEYISRK